METLKQCSSLRNATKLSRESHVLISFLLFMSSFNIISLIYFYSLIYIYIKIRIYLDLLKYQLMNFPSGDMQ